MDLQFWVIQAFNGISYGALLFLLASGLTLIFGVMRIVNLAHGSYFLLGGYVALSVIWATGSWLLALPVAALAIALVGLVMERVFLRPLGFDPLRQVLLTIGFAFLFQQLALDIWGGDHLDITPPDVLKESVVVGGLYFPVYRIFMIGMAVAIGLLLWLALDKTRMGAIVRAAVDDAEMAAAEHPCPFGDGIDAHAGERREVDHHAAVAGGLAGEAVAAAFDRDKHLTLAREIHASGTRHRHLR